MRRIAGWLLVTLSFSVASAHAAEPANATAAPAPDKKAAEDTERLPAKKTEPGLKNERRVVDESVKNEVDRRGRVRKERLEESREHAIREPGGRF